MGGLKDRFRHLDFFLIGIILLSVFMNFFLLNQAGTNEYYAVAVKSMMQNMHAFFYASFDPAGFITVDKPPVALWLQAISAKVFGFSNFSLLLPEALAAVASTILVYQMVKQQAGKLAAFISGVTMSVTPIFIAISRTNNMDSILILTLVIAAWAVMKAVRTSRVRWLIVSAALIGIGFNVKMLEAFMIVPAIYLFYWIAARTHWKKKLIHLLAATVVLVGISLSWAVAVDLVPDSQRPYIGGSQTNSVLELAFGYNGLSRLTGDQGGGAGPGMTRSASDAGAMQQEGGNASPFGTSNGSSTTDAGGDAAGSSTANQTGDAPSGMNGGPGGGGGNQGGMFGTGTAGPLRLFSKELSGQASWLLPFVFIGAIALAAEWICRKKLDETLRFAIFWMSWLIPAMIFFSIAGFFHQYYLSLMAPPIAALTGLGFMYMWRDFRDPQSGWRGCLLPAAFGATLFFEAAIFYQNGIDTLWVLLLITAGTLALAAGILLRSADRKFLGIVAGTGVALMMLAPLYWTLPSTFNQTNSSTPVAGPTSTLSGMGTPGGMGGSQGNNFAASGSGGQADENGSGNQPPSFGTGSAGPGQPPEMGGSDDRSGGMNSGNADAGSENQSTGNRQPGGLGEESSTELLHYLEKQYKGEKYILAVESAQSAYSIMLNSDYAVMAMGGFSGSDPALTADKLEKMAEAGEIRYFLIGGRGGAQNAEVTEWIEENCEEVPASQWQGEDSNSGSTSQNGPDGQSTLYVYNK